jgi:ubiquinone/menaquinone biosynthesis C-methylase UbiE
VALDRLFQMYIGLKSDSKSRGKLYDLLYKQRWGSVATNNYGFAPADEQGPERFQLQIYKELFKLLSASRREQTHTDLLEVACGRGGGLVYLLKLLPGSSAAVGLDFSQTALQFCTQTYGQFKSLTFVCGSALELPFADESFDVLLNVEASHNFGGYRGFFKEVHRVLRPGGAFLYCDYDRPELVRDIEKAMRDTALNGELRDITGHVAEACRLDSERRRQLIHDFLPWYYRILVSTYLADYAAIEGTGKFEAFRTSGWLYFMTCALRS